jgi:Holliday junction resolvase-like predicted endonuclease
MQFGEGDILAEEKNGASLMAIECKYIDNIATGKTAKVRRTKHRKKVVEQALLHASYVKIRNPHRLVKALTLTNEAGLTVIASDVCLLDAKRRVLDFMSSVWHGFIPCCAVPELKRLFGDF